MIKGCCRRQLHNCEDGIFRSVAFAIAERCEVLFSRLRPCGVNVCVCKRERERERDSPAGKEPGLV